MDGKQKMAIAVVGAVIALCAVTAVTAHSRTQNTPLYTVRMEQASSQMNFLPTAMNEFTYSAESGCTLNCNVSGYCGAEPLITHQADTFCTCFPYCETTEYTCESDPTCMITCNTCIDPTCPFTCFSTCPDTCPNTCDGATCTQPTCEETCPSTCDTCQGWTCDATGCQFTCFTCGLTCEQTCPPRKTCDPIMCYTRECQP